MSAWEFWIDVGGTFTDCIARRPDGSLDRTKVLSSGAFRGRVTQGSTANVIRWEDTSPEDFLTGYRITLLPPHVGSAVITKHDADQHLLHLAQPLDAPVGAAFELTSGEEAPVLGIRKLLGRKLAEPIGKVIVRLGTTRGTNALLERQGAAVAFVTTAGFGDILRIGTQNRPRLFDLAIRKPADLFRVSVELPERIDALGKVLLPLSPQAVEDALGPLVEQGIESLAVCLLNSYRNPIHEEVVAKVASQFPFKHVALSTQLAPLQRIVPRGQTTAVDAYLTPIIRDYIGKLRRSLPDADLKLMTSAGSLIDAERFVGKDSVLSGPAGGVVGSAHIAREAGFAKAIGFDMGGTSTDVSRFDGDVERRYEMDVVDPTTGGTLKIVAPMLSIETVAAGGGSICEFDGQRITVGPRSGGSNPGPACYGRGGPLCITDVNLFLGRILPEHFAFPLDRKVVLDRLNDIQQRMKKATGEAPSLEKLAMGFTAVANANMAAAIKKVSVARGYDVREYALVSFGGAGAQHACAIATELGITRILQHPYASLLSAFGIGIADVTRFAVHDVGWQLNQETLHKLESPFAEMLAGVREQVLAEGIVASDLQQPIRRLELRYVGQDATLPIAEPDDGNYAAAFEAAHRQLYGFAFPGRAIEVRTARLELTGRTRKPITKKLPLKNRTPEVRETVPAFFGSKWIEAPVHRRNDLQAGDMIAGPAIIVEPHSSIVVEPHWTATVSERDDLVLTAN